MCSFVLFSFLCELFFFQILSTSIPFSSFPVWFVDTISSVMYLQVGSVVVSFLWVCGLECDLLCNCNIYFSF